MNFKVISRNVGFALLTSAFFMFLSILVSLANGNDSALAALSISFVITFMVGFFPFIFVRNSDNITLKDGFMIIVLSWSLSFIFGMLPYVLWGGPFSVINAFFESVSGYTTTGATILENVEALPNSLLFWRSSTHFIGGLGVVVFLLLIIPSSSPVRLRLTNLEISSLSREGYRSRANKTVIIYSSVYFGLAVTSFLSYWVAGMSAFDAINHAFSVCATGGFSTRNLSIGAYNSSVINAVTIVFMFLCSVHFGTLFMTVVTRSLKPLNSPVFKYYVSTVVVACLVVSFTLRIGDSGLGLGGALEQGIFHTLSFVSTTGFAIGDNNLWPAFANVVMLFLGLQCGMAGSTVGGIKADRLYLLFKSISQQVKHVLHPSSVNQIHVRNHIIRIEEVFPHILFIGLYMLLLCLSTALTVLSGMDGNNALYASVSCLSNVGPAIGDMGTLGNFNGITAMSKFILCLDMFVGRLEIYPVLAVVIMVFRIGKR
ncbi:MAG: TrkH family potassium uptake protein [Bacteroidales bacterium]|nr:TrkH family potassium uptake protein [Bacteroidales bacterium]